MDNTALWKAVLGELELALSSANFKTWFKNTEVISQDNGIIVLSVPNIFNKEWIEKKYKKQIDEILRGLLRGFRMLEFRIGSPALVKESIAADNLVEIEEIEEPNLNGSLHPSYTFGSFVVGSSNKLAYAAAQNVAKNPGKEYNPLFIYGGVGLGKTHLMQAIGNEITSRNKKKKVVYVTSEGWTNEFITAIAKRTTNQFKERYRKVDVLLIDDVQFLAGKSGTQEEFFHNFNALHQEQKQIVMTCDRPPKVIPTLEDRLKSRLEWGMMADIQSPDIETRTAILQRKAQTKGYDLPLEVLDYISKQIQQNVRELEGALNRLIAYCKLNDVAMNLKSAQAALGSLKARERRGVGAKQVLEKCADFYDIDLSDILGKKRDKEIVVPRQVAMYLMREELKLSYPKIAQEVGGKDHTTVMHAVGKIEKQIDLDEPLRQDISLLKERLYG